MKKTDSGEITILHLSDLHIAPSEIFRDKRLKTLEKKYWRLFQEGKTEHAVFWHRSNLDRITTSFQANETSQIDHIVITGDCVTCGFEEEYEIIYEGLLKLQKAVFLIDKPTLEPDRFSVIPGNHDINDSPSRIKRCLRRAKLLPIHYASRKKMGKRLMKYSTFHESYSIFQKYFSSLYPTFEFKSLEKEIFCKTLSGTNISLVHLVSTTNVPIRYPWCNANGFITGDQMTALSKIENGYFNILLMHHPPIAPPSVAWEGPMLELINAQQFYGLLLENQQINFILCGHDHKFYIWDNHELPDGLDGSHRQYNIPIVVSDASTKGNVSNTLHLPIYKIETADKLNVTFDNSNINVWLRTIPNNGEIFNNFVKQINCSKLGSAFACLKRVEVNGYEPSRLTAEKQMLLVDDPQENDYFDIPFDKPAQNVCVWTLNIISDSSLGGSKGNAQLSISLLDSQRKMTRRLKERIRITEEVKPIEFSFNANEAGFVRISFDRIATNRIKILRIENKENEYL